MCYTTDLFSALACDCLDLSFGSGEKEQILGVHSVNRLWQMWEGVRYARQCGTVPTFCFSAGRMVPYRARLCDLQAQWVKEQWREMGWGGSPLICLPSENENIWGTEEELEYIAKVANDFARFSEVTVEIATEDYHGKRAQYLMQKMGLNARLYLASSVQFPPTSAELWHERKAYWARRFLPKRLYQKLQTLSHQSKMTCG